MKSKTTPESQLLDLLRKILPKATHDAGLAEKIYQAAANELKMKERETAFEKFCHRCDLPDLETKTVDVVKGKFDELFPDGDVTIKPHKKDEVLAVEVALPDGVQLQGEIKVKTAAEIEDGEDQDVVLKFVPFPVSLPGDPELIWLLAKRENLSPEEAGMALARTEDDFWGSKAGQKLLKDRVERAFPEFISRVPSGLLSEAGLKRHYKEPEPIKVLHPVAPPAAKKSK